MKTTELVYNRTECLANLACKLQLSLRESVALPAVVDRAAEVVGLTVPQLLWHCQTKPLLAAYVAKVCRNVMQAVDLQEEFQKAIAGVVAEKLEVSGN